MFSLTRKAFPIFAAILLLACWGVASAEESGIFAKSNFSGTLTGTSDYVFRGISQTNENIAVQGSFDYAHPVGLYLGAWGSNVDSGTARGGIELDYYVGFSREIASTGLSYDLGGVYYNYPKSGSDPEPDYIEGYFGLSYTIPIALKPSLGAKYYYSPDFFGEDDTGQYVNGTVGLSLPYGFGLGFEIGYQDVAGDKTTPDGFDYVNYRIGATYTLVGFDLDLSFSNTTSNDEFDNDSLMDERFVFTMSRSM